MAKVKYVVELEVEINDKTEQAIKASGINLANVLPNVLDHDPNTQNVNVLDIQGSITLNVDCLSE